MEVNMRVFTFIIFSIIFSSLSGAQVIQRITTYNGIGNGVDVPKGIFMDSLGNVYVTGYSWGGTSKEDYATVKYDKNGYELWVSRYNGTGNSLDIPSGITVDNAGNVYVTGWSRSGSSYGSEDYCTIKYNSSGVQQWVKRYNGSGSYYDYAYGIGVDANGNVYVTGTSTIVLNSCEYREDIVTIKYNASGTQQWVVSYNGPSNKNDGASAIFVDNSGYSNVTGYSFSNNDSNDCITLKYNSAGVLQWASRFAGASHRNDLGKDIVGDEFGNIYITGNTMHNISKLDFLTIKYSANGIQQWIAIQNGSGNDSDYANSIDLDNHGFVYVTGASKGAGSNFDYLTCQYTPFGSLTWSKTYNGSGNGIDIPEEIKVLRNPNIHIVDLVFYIYVTGKTKSNVSSYDYSTICYLSTGNTLWQRNYNSPSNSDDAGIGVAARYKIENIVITGVSNNDYSTIWYTAYGEDRENHAENLTGLQDKILKSYPNPFNPVTMISFTSVEECYGELVIYDVQGNQICSLHKGNFVQGKNSFYWNASQNSSGVYFAVLKQEHSTEIFRLLLVK